MQILFLHVHLLGKLTIFHVSQSSLALLFPSFCDSASIWAHAPPNLRDTPLNRMAGIFCRCSAGVRDLGRQGCLNSGFKVGHVFRETSQAVKRGKIKELH